MVIIAKSTLSEFVKSYPDAAEPLNHWYQIARNSNWATFAHIKESFNSVDAVGNDRFVFNIKGNHYRLVTMIHFNKRTVYIRFLGTHEAYDNINCSKI